MYLFASMNRYSPRTKIQAYCLVSGGYCVNSFYIFSTLVVLKIEEYHSDIPLVLAREYSVTRLWSKKNYKEPKVH